MNPRLSCCILEADATDSVINNGHIINLDLYYGHIPTKRLIFMNTQKTIPAGEFKQKCLALMDEVATLGTELIITKHGTPVCKLTPLTQTKTQKRFGWLADSVTIHGDLTKPTGEKWDADE